MSTESTDGNHTSLYRAVEGGVVKIDLASGKQTFYQTRSDSLVCGSPCPYGEPVRDSTEK